MVRKAAGAIVEKNGRFLLVNKVKISDCENTVQIDGEWDFSKGGVKENEPFEKAVLRELKEETGSEQYRIIKQFDEKIVFEFPENIKSKIGFESQDTVMFHIEYMGDESELTPQDDEIESIVFYPKHEVLNKLHHADTKEYFRKYFL